MEIASVLQTLDRLYMLLIMSFAVNDEDPKEVQEEEVARDRIRAVIAENREMLLVEFSQDMKILREGGQIEGFRGFVAEDLLRSLS